MTQLSDEQVNHCLSPDRARSRPPNAMTSAARVLELLETLPAISARSSA